MIKAVQYINLRKFIKKRRLENDISLNSFAFENDIDPAILSRIENLKQNIKLNILEKIAQGFSATPAQFLTEFENDDGVFDK